jgi:hypothetical protein
VKQERISDIPEPGNKPQTFPKQEINFRYSRNRKQTSDTPEKENKLQVLPKQEQTSATPETGTKLQILPKRETNFRHYR